MKNFTNFILESYGKNNLVVKLTNYLTGIININLDKLILHENIVLKVFLKEFKEIVFVNDIINISIADKTYGNIDGIEIEDDKIIDLVMNLEIKLSDNEKLLKRLESNNISSTINHEFLHVIERYLTLSNGKTISKSWHYAKKLKKLQRKYPDYIEWQNVSYFIYLSFPHEMRSRVSSLYEQIEKIKDKSIKNVIVFIKKHKYFQDADFLSKVDVNILIKKLKSDKNYRNLILDFNSYFLENNKMDLVLCEQEFIKYMKMIKSKNEKLKKKLLKISYSFENTFFDFGFSFENEKDIKYSDYLDE